MKETASSQYVAVIGDLVASREHPDRAAVQRGLVDALQVTAERVESVQVPEPTIGDEFQAVYADLASAVHATLLVRLALPDEVDARFGIGIGSLEVVGASAYGLTQDGPAWWAARAAVDAAEARERRVPAARTWVGRHDPTDDSEALMNAYLLCRDQLVGDLDGRQRRLALGVLDGRTLADIAAEEGVSASAISQRYRRGVGAVVESARQVIA